MGKKCSVVGCTTNYKSSSLKEKVPVYSFPSDKDKCREWVICLPNKLAVENVTGNMGVCALHWPKDVPLTRASRSRHLVPAVPPSIFPNVPQSCIPTSNQTTPRPTKKATQSARAVDVDQMSDFLDQDTIKLQNYQDKFLDKLRCHGFAAMSMNASSSTYVFLSQERKGPIPNHSIYFKAVEDVGAMRFEFEAYSNVKKLSHPFLRSIQFWSQLDELIRFVMASTVDESDKKLNFINSSIDLLNTPKNSRLYNHQDLLRAFTWVSLSRSLYNQLRTWIQLPSLSTLSKTCAAAKSKSDDRLFTSVFSTVSECCRFCIIIVDEVYVKASISYRGGSIFGYAVDTPGKIATMLLCIMVKCFFEGQNL